MSTRTPQELLSLVEEALKQPAVLAAITRATSGPGIDVGQPRAQALPNRSTGVCLGVTNVTVQPNAAIMYGLRLIEEAVAAMAKNTSAAFAAHEPRPEQVEPCCDTHRMRTGED